MIDFESWTCLSAMLEPSPRYSAAGVGGGGGAGGGGHTMQIDTHNLESAVDLSRKSTSESTAVGTPGELEGDQEDSEDEAPLDLKVRPRTGSTSSLGGKPPMLNLSPEIQQRAEQSFPGPAQRAELLRIAELYTSGGNPPPSLPLPPNIRNSSQERDTGALESACSLCGEDTQSPSFRPSDHGENICGRGTISCPLCAKTFSLWSHYEAHKKCHQKLKQRQYPCQTCGKVFTSASNRNMHQRIHKGVRPFQCTPCGVFFRQKAHLQKHQKTQGHIQATEIYEKKKRDGLIADNDDTSSITSADSSQKKNNSQQRPESVKSVDSSHSTSTNSSNLIADSTQAMTPPGIADSSMSEQSPTLTSSGGSGSTVRSSRSKSSPKRKQAKPSQVVQEEHTSEAEDTTVSTSEDKVKSFIDFNEVSHGYDCRQCAFASHDLSVLKDHVKEEHMALERPDKLKCRECQITFSKEFNLRIHNRKHETSSQYLPCDHCEQVFKVPNKLIKHMEGVHSVCPTCGERQEDKASLMRHLDDIHGEQRSRGFHTNLMQFTPLMSHLSSPKSTSSPLSLENRMAKKLKVDSLAETIRQKKQQLKNNNSSTVLNGNTKTSSPLGSPTMPRRRKNELPSVRSFAQSRAAHEALSTSFLHLQPQPMSKLSGVPDLLHKGENNNVLSIANLKLPPSIRLPTQPVAGLTPPSSPPPPVPNFQHPLPPQQIRGEVSVTIVSGGGGHSDDSESEETGLDLSISSRRRNSDEHEVSTTHNAPVDLYSNLPLLASTAARVAPASTFPAPPHMTGFPFPFLPPVPPGTDPVLAEHILKLAALQQQHQRGSVPPHPTPQSDLAKSSLSSPYTVLSAMLGHAPYPTVFPGMSPASLFPNTPNPQASPSAPPSTSSSAAAAAASSNQDSENSPPQLVSSEKKPFHCTFCRKEFGHLSSLESHMEHMHSGDAKHACETCGKSFSSKSNLTAHKKIHSGERPFECVVCHKRFRQKAHLQKHETTHSSATPYQCNVCDKAFGHISNLNTHMATHSNVRPYQCADCGKSYKDSASFKRHRLGHTGERPYPCSLCQDAFIDSKSLRRHRELVHPNDPKWEDDDDDDLDDDEDDTQSTSMTPSTSAYSSFESGQMDESKNKHEDEDEEIEVDKEMAEDEEEEEIIDPSGHSPQPQQQEAEEEEEEEEGEKEASSSSS